MTSDEDWGPLSLPIRDLPEIEQAQASVVIPTRNRGPELAILLRSLCAQTVPLDVLVMDDGASDDTKGLIETEFPEVKYYRLGFNKGPAFQRNRGIALASCNIVFPFDDDTELRAPDTIENTLAEFDDPRIGAVGMPYINIRQDNVVRQQAPRRDEVYLIHAFVGAAHAIRRDVFLSVGGYREHFFYMGEEGDLCLRMLAAGYVTRLGNANPIHHLESPNRNSRLAARSGRRNDILFAWQNVPTLWFPFFLTATSVNGIRSAFASPLTKTHLAGIVDGYRAMMFRAHKRQPVPSRAFLIHRRLKSQPRKLTNIEHALPASKEQSGTMVRSKPSKLMSVIRRSRGWLFDTWRLPRQ